MLRFVIYVEIKQKIPSITYIFETNDEQKMLINVLEQIDCQNVNLEKKSLHISEYRFRYNDMFSSEEERYTMISEYISFVLLIYIFYYF